MAIQAEVQPVTAGARINPLLVVAMGVLGLSVAAIQMGLNGTLQAILSHGPLALTSDEIGLLISANYLGAVLGAPLFGVVSDALGRKMPMVLAVALTAIGSLALQFSHSYPSLLASRLLGGLGIGGYMAMIYPYFVETLPQRWRGPASLGCHGLSALLTLASILAMRRMVQWDPLEGWRLEFLFLGVTGLVVAAAHLLLPGKPVGVARPDPCTATAEEEEERPALIADHRATFIAFLVSYTVLPLSIAGFFLTVALIMLARHYPAEASLAVTSAAAGGSVLGLLASVFIANRVSRAALIVGGCLVGTAGAVLFAASTGLAGAMIGGAGVMLGSALAYTVLNIYTAESFPQQIRGRVSGILMGVNRLMTVLTPLAMTYVIGRVGEGPALVVIGGSMLVPAVAIGVHARRAKG